MLLAPARPAPPPAPPASRPTAQPPFSDTHTRASTRSPGPPASGRGQAGPRRPRCRPCRPGGPGVDGGGGMGWRAGAACGACGRTPRVRAACRSPRPLPHRPRTAQSLFPVLRHPPAARGPWGIAREAPRRGQWAPLGWVGCVGGVRGEQAASGSGIGVGEVGGAWKEGVTALGGGHGPSRQVARHRRRRARRCPAHHYGAHPFSAWGQERVGMPPPPWRPPRPPAAGGRRAAPFSAALVRGTPTVRAWGGPMGRARESGMDCGVESMSSAPGSGAIHAPFRAAPGPALPGARRVDAVPLRPPQPPLRQPNPVQGL